MYVYMYMNIDMVGAPARRRYTHTYTHTHTHTHTHLSAVEELQCARVEHDVLVHTCHTVSPRIPPQPYTPDVHILLPPYLRAILPPPPPILASAEEAFSDTALVTVGLLALLALLALGLLGLLALALLPVPLTLSPETLSP
jgi:hypothetical protein